MRLIAMFLLLGFCVGTSAAQDSTPFPIIERCITAPTEPPDDWTFEGTIITFRQGDGVHGFRADSSSRYYIAFDSQTEYARFGSLSPDGKWFVSFIGGSEAGGLYTSNSNYYIDQIRVVSTLPLRKLYFVPLESYQYEVYPMFRTVLWIDSITFAAFQDQGLTIKSRWYLINPFLGTIEEISDEQDKELEKQYLKPIPTHIEVGFSP